MARKLLFVLVGVSIMLAAGLPAYSTDTMVEENVLAGEKDALGNQAVPLSAVELTEEDKAALKEKTGQFTAAIVMHYLGSDWSKLQVKGMEDTFKQYGVTVTSVMGAEFRQDEHIMKLKRVIRKKPDVLLSIPVNDVEEADTYKQVSENGIRLVMLDMIPQGLEHPADYVTMVTTSNKLNGGMAADILGEYLQGQGEVGILELAVPFFVTEQRVVGFEERLKESYPGIKVVGRAQFGGEAVTMEEARLKTEELLAAHPEIDGLFAVWIEPAMAAVEAAEKVGRTPQDFAIVTADIEEAGSLEIARDGFVKGTVSDFPYIMGQAEALAALRSLLGHDVPAFIAVPGMKVTRSNLLESYRQVLQREPSEEMKNLLAQ